MGTRLPKVNFRFSERPTSFEELRSFVVEKKKQLSDESKQFNMNGEFRYYSALASDFLSKQVLPNLTPSSWSPVLEDLRDDLEYNTKITAQSEWDFKNISLRLAVLEYLLDVIYELEARQ